MNKKIPLLHPSTNHLVSQHDNTLNLTNKFNVSGQL